jgi:hypothetical protein
VVGFSILTTIYAEASRKGAVMGGFISYLLGKKGPLTKPAMVGPDGQPKFYNDTQGAMDAGAQALNATPQEPSVSVQQPQVAAGAAPNPDGTPNLNFSGGQATLTDPSEKALPHYADPSFQDRTTDAYGNVTKGNSPGLTKLGVFAKFLNGATQGTLDAVSSGALNAERGKSYFGAGASGAMQMPFQRAAMQQQQQHGQLENQQLQNVANAYGTPYKIQNPDGSTSIIPMGLAQPIVKMNAEQAAARKDQLVATRPGGGIYDSSTGAYAPGTEPQDKSPDVQHMVAAASQKALSEGRDPSTDPTVKALQTVVDNGKTDKQPTSVDQMWNDAFSKENGHPPGSQDVQNYEHAKALAIHITNPTPQPDAGDMDTIVKGLVDGSLDATKVFSSRGGGQIRAHAIAEAKRMDPSFDMSTYPARQAVAKDFADGKAADQIQSFNTFLAHAQDLSTAVDGLRNTSSPLINRPLNWLRKNMDNSAELQGYLAKIQPVSDEFESFLQNNHALTVEDKASAQKILDPTLSPAQMEASIKSFAHTAALRLSNTNQKYQNTFHKDYPGMLTPESSQYLDSLGFLKNAHASGPSTAPNQPAAQSDFQKKVSGAGGFVLP